jgi:hypothetical protein
MTKQQFDMLVGEVSDALARSLTERGIVVQPPAAAVPAPDKGNVVADRAAELVRRLPIVLGTVPILPAQTLRTVDRVDRAAAGGTSTWQFLGLLAFAGALTIALGLAVRRLAAMHGKPLNTKQNGVPLRKVALAAIRDCGSASK